jgi:hypothetical protein
LRVLNFKIQGLEAQNSSKVHVSNIPGLEPWNYFSFKPIYYINSQHESENFMSNPNISALSTADVGTGINQHLEERQHQGILDKEYAAY